MKAIFIELPETKLIFHLFDDDVDLKMSKKLKKLGLADISIDYPLEESENYADEGGGIYRQGLFACGSFRITSACPDAKFSTIFDEKTKEIHVTLEGRFFSINHLDDERAYVGSDQTRGFVAGARLRSDTGKLIKKPKDDWGILSPIEALVEKETYNGAALEVNFKVIIEDAEY
jgi:hypothetical protein